jgi:5-methylcytosine-specific restriction endonuclease McrA
LFILKVNWDHVVPFSYSQNNYAYNFVAACQICNGIKGSQMFKTLEEARIHIRAIRDVRVEDGTRLRSDT